MKTLGAAALAALLSFPALARKPTDILVMKNGDRITCEVKKLENGVLQVNLGYVDGTISIDWLKVARLESKELFLVQLSDGSIYSGRIVNPEALSGTPVKIEIQNQEQGSPAVDRSDVVRMTQTSESLVKRFSGALTIGALYSKGNNTTQYNIGSELDYQQTRWGGRLTYSSSLSSSSGAPTATRNQVDLNAYRLLRWKKYFFGGSAGFLQGSVQGIQRQTSLGFGAGRFLKNSNHVRFSVLAGLGWQGTNYVPSALNERSQNIGVALISTNLDVFTFKKTHLSFSGNLAPAVTQTGRLFAKVNATYYLKVLGKIDWNLSFYGNWDTQPPPPLLSSDYGTSTGISYTFGNR